jgi:hypothetical protein
MLALRGHFEERLRRVLPAPVVMRLLYGCLKKLVVELWPCVSDAISWQTGAFTQPS